VSLLPATFTLAPAAAAAQKSSLDVEIAGATVHVRGHPCTEALLDVFSTLRRSREC
jgi:hypothetical protein